MLLTGHTIIKLEQGVFLVFSNLKLNGDARKRIERHAKSVINAWNFAQHLFEWCQHQGFNFARTGARQRYGYVIQSAVCRASS